MGRGNIREGGAFSSMFHFRRAPQRSLEEMEGFKTRGEAHNALQTEAAPPPPPPRSTTIVLHTL